MATDISDRVREIAEARGLAESAVLERALERGVDELYRGLVLSLYFDGELTRDEAVERLGGAIVERADRERDAVESDVASGLNA